MNFLRKRPPFSPFFPFLGIMPPLANIPFKATNQACTWQSDWPPLSVAREPKYAVSEARTSRESKRAVIKG
jgi:hypothetical protein